MAFAQDRPSGVAIAALVLGILSFLGFSVLTGIPAWVLGKKELSAIRAGRSPAAGQGLAQIGMWLGIVNTVLSVLAVLFAFVLLAGVIGWGASVTAPPGVLLSR